jgi:hypothetical protein
MKTAVSHAEIAPMLPEHLRTTGAEHAESLVKEILGSEYHLRDAD